ACGGDPGPGRRSGPARFLAGSHLYSQAICSPGICRAISRAIETSSYFYSFITLSTIPPGQGGTRSLVLCCPSRSLSYRCPGSAPLVTPDQRRSQGCGAVDPASFVPHSAAISVLPTSCS